MCCRCWGGNNLGQLGNGYSNSTNVVIPPSWDLMTGVSQVAAGSGFTCVLLVANGAVQCFGTGSNGVLGAGNTLSVNNAAAASKILNGAVWISTSSVSNYACAVLSNGSLYCWGSNSYNQIGNNSTSGGNVLTPTTVAGLSSGVTSVDTGQYSTCALLSNGSVSCWGYAAQGQIGNGISINVYSPPTSDIPGLNAVQISVGQLHTCVVLQSAGVRCWGGNTNGQIGQPSSVLWLATPPTSDLIGNVSQVSCGEYHTCLLMANTTGVRCFGYNGYGQLGTGSMASLNTVPSVDVLLGVVQLSAGYTSTCVLMNTTGIRWGSPYLCAFLL